MTGSSRKGTAFAAALTLALFLSPQAAPETHPPDSWWQGFLKLFAPQPEEPLTEVSNDPSLANAGPKSRCHIIINGVSYEYECD